MAVGPLDFSKVQTMTEEEAYKLEQEYSQIDSVRAVVYKLEPKYTAERKALRERWATLYAERLGITADS